MFFRQSSTEPDAPVEASAELDALVHAHMPDADRDTVAIVGGLAGLLAHVAHADREYAREEADHIRKWLARVHGLTPAGVDAVCQLLDARIRELSLESLQSFTRAIYEKMDRSARLEVLEVLVDLAAADGVITLDETQLLSRITRALGLSHDEYVACQARHRDRLSVLK